MRSASARAPASSWQKEPIGALLRSR
jgi:hypothetical protein